MPTDLISMDGRTVTAAYTYDNNPNIVFFEAGDVHGAVMPGTRIRIDETQEGEGVAAVITAAPPELPVDAPNARWTPEALDELFELIENGTPLTEAIANVGSTLPTMQLISSDPNGLIGEPTCIARDQDPMYMKGCDRTYRGNIENGFLYRPDTWDAIVRSTKSGFNAREATMTASFASDIIQASPKRETTIAQCASFTVGVSRSVVNVSYSRPVCPDKLSPTETMKALKVSWKGKAGVGSQQATEGADLTKTNVAAGDKRGQSFQFGGVVHPYSGNSTVDKILEGFLGSLIEV